MSKTTLFLLGIFLLFTFSAYAAEPIGAVIAIYGEAGVINSAGRSPLALKDTLMESDTVVTALNSKVQILLRDGSTITLGEATELELKEFSDIGASPNFTADFMKGSLRIITGKITEANPKGFKITTQHSTVGVRGTILSLRTDENSTTLMVLNSDKTVLFNGAAVNENQKAAARLGGKPVITALTSQEKEAEIREMIVIDEDSSTLSFYRPFTDIPDIQYTAAVATITGIHGSDTDSTFSFDVNVLNGTISGANTKGSYFSVGYGTVSWELKGSGKFSAERGFEVRNFEGIAIDKTYPLPPGRDNYEMDAQNTHLTLKLDNKVLTGNLNLRLHDPSVSGSGDTITIPANARM